MPVHAAAVSISEHWAVRCLHWGGDAATSHTQLPEHVVFALLLHAMAFPGVTAIVFDLELLSIADDLLDRGDYDDGDEADLAET